MPFLPLLLIGFAISLVSYLLMPKPDLSSAQRDSEELKSPTASPNKPLPVIFGTVRIKAPNVIAFTDANKTDVDI